MSNLKDTLVLGKLIVTDKVVADKIVKLGGTANEVLCADGSTTILSGLGAGTVTSVGVANGGGLSVSGSPITSSGTITISHADTSSASNLTTSDRRYVTGLTFDTYGHVTGYTTGTESNQDLSNYVNLTDNQTIAGNKVFTGTTSTMTLHTYSPLYINNGTDNSKNTSLYTDTDGVFKIVNSSSSVTRPTYNGTGIALTSDIPTLPTNYVTTDTTQTITGAKTFSAANFFTNETIFRNDTYAPTWTDIASGIGKSSCFTRGAFMQMITGQILLPNAAASDSGKGYNTEDNKLKFQTMTANGNGQPVVTDVASLDSSGFTASGYKVSGSSDSYVLLAGGGTKALSEIGGSGGGGDVYGPSSSTNNAVARFDGATGKIIKNSNATINDNGIIIANGFGDGTITIKPHASNEVNFGGTDTGTTIYFGHQGVDSRPKPTLYVFGGVAADASVQANEFKKTGSNNNYVLLGGGGHKALSEFQTSGNYVTLDTAQTISGKKTFTNGMKVSGRFVGAAGGDDEGIIVGRADNNYAGLCLGEPSGVRSVFYLTPTNEALWRYYNGAVYDIKHPGKSGTIALTSDLSGYLPLAGGTMTGNIIIQHHNSYLGLQDPTGNIAYFQTHNDGSGWKAGFGYSWVNSLKLDASGNMSVVGNISENGVALSDKYASKGDIPSIVVTDSLPSSPDSSTLYFITG